MNSFKKIKERISFKNAFTLVEILVATFISTMVLSVIFIFLTDIVESIGYTKKEVTTLSSFYEFNNKINNLRNIYVTGGILIDTSTGSDIFLMKDIKGENGILIGPVKLLDYKLSTNSSIYEDKGIGFRKLTKNEITTVKGDSNLALDLVFQKDQIFSDLKIQDFALISYNSGLIYNLNLTLDLYFQNNLIGEVWSNLPKNSLIKLNIDF